MLPGERSGSVDRLKWQADPGGGLGAGGDVWPGTAVAGRIRKTAGPRDSDHHGLPNLEPVEEPVPALVVVFYRCALIRCQLARKKTRHHARRS